MKLLIRSSMRWPNMRPDLGDIIRYKLGMTKVNGEWVEELSDDFGTVISVSDNDIGVFWSVTQRIEHHSPGDLVVVVRRSK